jgi:hypothetical protein
VSTKLFVFEPNDLLRLMTHYTEGQIPLDAEAMNVGVNPMLQRFVGIECRSKEWTDWEPLHFRYDGGKVLSWTKGTGEEPKWTEANETPTRQ